MAIPPLATAVTSNQATAALLPTLPPPSPACLLIRCETNPPSFIVETSPHTGLVCGRVWDAQPLSQRGDHCLPRQQLEARTQVFYFSTFTQLVVGVRDNSFQFLETFAKLLTDGQSESCS